MSIVRTWFNPQLKYLNLKRNEEYNQLSTNDINSMWVPWIVFENVENEHEVKKTGIKDKIKFIPNQGFLFTRSDKTYFQNTMIFEGSQNAINYTKVSRYTDWKIHTKCRNF